MHCSHGLALAMCAIMLNPGNKIVLENQTSKTRNLQFWPHSGKKIVYLASCGRKPLPLLLDFLMKSYYEFLIRLTFEIKIDSHQ